MTTITMITTGESPRSDLVPYLEARLTSGPEVVEFGVLDGLDDRQREALGPEPGDVASCARLQDGTNILVVQRKVSPIVQSIVDRAAEAGASAAVILCGRDWSEIRSTIPLVNPGTLFPAVIGSLAAGRRLGVIKPLEQQLEPVRQLYGARGIKTWAAAASPYTPERLEAAEAAAHHLRDADVDIIWMSCVGMDEDMRQVVQDITHRPVILARSLLARIIDELALAGTPAPQLTGGPGPGR